MRIFTAQQKQLIAKAVRLVNLSPSPINNLSSSPKTKEDELYEGLNERQVAFLETAGKGFSFEEKLAIKNKILKDPGSMINYQNRSMLKDGGAMGKLLPKGAFNFNVNYPSRGFRNITRKK